MNKALLVGINKYSSAPLRGCVNDVTDMADFLVARYNFLPSEVRILVDERATTGEILTRLNWLVSDLKPGDRILFHYSGHGAQVATRNPAQEVDGLDEIICPVDFDWSDARMIRDKQFQSIFSVIPDGVTFNWISDSCHSGDLTRGFSSNPHVIISKTYPVPADIQWRNGVATRQLNIQPQLLHGQIHVGFISGCRSDQTSADTSVNNRPCGALTHYLLEALSDTGHTVPLAETVTQVNRLLSANGFTQQPQLGGDQVNKPFMG